MTDLEDQLEARGRLEALLPGGTRSAATRSPVFDAVVTHIEVNEKHGVGALLQTLFGSGEGMAVVRSDNHFGGKQAFGERCLRLIHGEAPRPAVYATVLRALGGMNVRRILCCPYYVDDVRSAIALRDVSGAPLCTWIMDDRNVCEDGIPDELLAELLAKSSLRLGISPELRDAYRAKFGVPFWLGPPVVPAHLVLETVAPELPGGEGAIVGNIWGRRWLDHLRRAVRGAGLKLDWYSPSGFQTAWCRYSVDEVAADGIRACGALEEAEYVKRLRRAPYVVVPSGLLDDAEDRRAIARLSLPSRIPYVLATAQAPVIVVGHPETAAAHFVVRTGTGVAVPYEAEPLRRAVEEVCRPETQRAMRSRAARLASVLSARGAVDWLWRSVEAGEPVDRRFEELVPPP
ncbi:MAG TPA: hypothetical protein VMK42_20070 [Anaeromyxobacteraceae bacterium]|nr:hypothetical protein [Anaeromyxobacteraceae bacterium]